MRAAMRSRAVIDQATGILLGRHGGTLEAAFGELTRIAQDAHRSLRDTADDLVLRAQRPTPPQ
ncbi:ANTAR domain-containing protein [Cryptosporangium minutisporangium]